MTSDEARIVQFASDWDGDLHMFPRHLDEPDVEHRWEVWLHLSPDGRREKAPCTPTLMTVSGDSVSNPYWPGEHGRVPAWFIWTEDVVEIEIIIDRTKTVRFPYGVGVRFNKHLQ